MTEPHPDLAAIERRAQAAESDWQAAEAVILRLREQIERVRVECSRHRDASWVLGAVHALDTLKHRLFVPPVASHETPPLPLQGDVTVDTPTDQLVQNLRDWGVSVEFTAWEMSQHRNGQSAEWLMGVGTRIKDAGQELMRRLHTTPPHQTRT